MDLRRAERLRAALASRSIARGSALIFALWIALLVGVAGVAAMRLAATGAGAVQIEADLARARAAAEGGIWAMAHHLAQAGEPSPRLALNFPVGSTQVAVVASDEDGRVDLNAAAAPLLRALFRTVGLPEPEAVALAEQVMRRREAAGRSKAFRTVDELAAVPGAPPGLVEAVEALATVHTGLAAPAIHVAPPALAAVLRAAEGNDGSRVASAQGSFRTPSSLRGGAGRRRVWRIEAAFVYGAVTARIRAVMLTEPGNGMPGRVLDWDPVAPDRGQR
jgi:DNA uptake protein ComE-like DNA-binding protein